MSIELTYDQYVKAGYAEEFLNWFVETGCYLPAFREEKVDDGGE